MHSYHVTIFMADGSRGVHVGLYHDSAAASSFAIDAFPDATRIAVMRLTTVLGLEAHGPGQPCTGRTA